MTGTPDAPIFIKKESEIINDPDTPVILDNIVQTIVDSSFSPISVTQELIDSESNNWWEELIFSILYSPPASPLEKS